MVLLRKHSKNEILIRRAASEKRNDNKVEIFKLLANIGTLTGELWNQYGGKLAKCRTM